MLSIIFVQNIVCMNFDFVTRSILVMVFLRRRVESSQECRSSYSSGYQLSCNGRSGSNKNTRKFIFGCGSLHRPYTARCSSGYRMDVESNSKNKYARKNDKSLPRRRLGFRPGAPQNLCTFRLVLFVDNIGFGIHVKSGHKSHKGHPKVKDTCLQLPQRLLSPNEKMVVLHSVDEDLQSCHSRNYLFKKDWSIYVKTKNLVYA